MAGFEQTIIIGNVGRKDDLKYTSSGVAVISFSVAVNRIWKDKASGEKREETNWYRVTCWRGLAETVNDYLTVGRQVMVAGRVSASAYVAQDGEARASLELVAQDVQFLGARGDAQDGGGYPTEPEDVPF